jgi:hypothetical protein
LNPNAINSARGEANRFHDEHHSQGVLDDLAAEVDFEVVEKIQETKVGGLPAAFVKANYKAKNQEGQEFKTLS